MALVGHLHLYHGAASAEAPAQQRQQQQQQHQQRQQLSHCLQISYPHDRSQQQQQQPQQPQQEQQQFKPKEPLEHEHPLEHVLLRLQRHDASLTICNLHCVSLGNRGAQRLADALQQQYSHSLVVLFLDNCDIEASGAVALAHSLSSISSSSRSSSASSLKYLYMSYNRIGDRGAAALAPLLNTCRVVKLMHNGIGDMGAMQLAWQLRKQPPQQQQEQQPSHYYPHYNYGNNNNVNACRVEQLDLQGNHIGVDGLCALMESLRSNTVLETLNVQHQRPSPLQQYSTPQQSSTSAAAWPLLLPGQLPHQLHPQQQQFILLQQQQRCSLLEKLVDVLQNDNKTIRILRLDIMTCASDNKLGSSSNNNNNMSVLQQTPPLLYADQYEQLQQQQEALQSRVDFYVSLNRLGRHSFGHAHIPAAAWARVLAKAAAAAASSTSTTIFNSADSAWEDWSHDSIVDGAHKSATRKKPEDRATLLFYLLQVRPDLLSGGGGGGG